MQADEERSLESVPISMRGPVAGLVRDRTVL